MGRRLIQKRSGVQSLLKFVHLNMINRKKTEKLCEETREYLLQYKAKRKQLEEERVAFLEKQRAEGKLNEEEIREIEIAIQSDTDDDEEYLAFINEKTLSDDEPSPEKNIDEASPERNIDEASPERENAEDYTMKNLQKRKLN